MDEGLVHLCLECCSSTTNHELVVEAMELLVIMLCKTKAKSSIQKHIFEYLCDIESTYFFLCIDGHLREIGFWCKQEFENQAAESDALEDGLVQLPDDCISLRLLQVLCDGEFHPLKVCSSQC